MRKATLNFCFGKTERAMKHRAMKKRFVVFISVQAVPSQKAADFLIVLQGK